VRVMARPLLMAIQHPKIISPSGAAAASARGFTQ